MEAIAAPLPRCREDRSAIADPILGRLVIATVATARTVAGDNSIGVQHPDDDAAAAVVVVVGPIFRPVTPYSAPRIRLHLG